MNPIILVHGGAWDIPDDQVESHLTGVTEAILRGKKALLDSALDAVVDAISCLEDDPTFDAGTGSFLNRDGVVELDAVITEGNSLRAGAVGATKRIKNPIRAARVIMEHCDTIFLTGEGAERFVAQQGITLCDNKELVIEREIKRWEELAKKKTPAEDFFKHGTVGAVAVDGQGTLVAGTSTGGTPSKQPGRIGDSPILGAGTYATDKCAVSCTGWGEAIMKAGMAKTIADFVDKGLEAQKAVEESVEILKNRFSGYGGAIVVTREGDYGIAYNTPRMARAVYAKGMEKPEADV
ncbi:MAG: isoaspartyl peptidase/L-asparaginase [Theionarchaea archaeon]|nr:isoaspartyl peptidase/L-asparaginase [Theionarchaea archaeon]